MLNFSSKFILHSRLWLPCFLSNSWSLCLVSFWYPWKYFLFMEEELINRRNKIPRYPPHHCFSYKIWALNLNRQVQFSLKFWCCDPPIVFQKQCGMGLVHKAEVSYMNLRTSNKKNSLGRFWLWKLTFLLCYSNSYVSINFKLGKQLTRKNPECWWPTSSTYSSYQ